MGNVRKEVIRKKGFPEGSPEEWYEEFYRNAASRHTDLILKKYGELKEGNKGRYINSDLMKMVFPRYRNDLMHRQKFNLSITNSAAVLTNEAFERAMQRDDIHRCIFLVGPYGAGKSYFAQSLFATNMYGLLDDSVLYEGSITPPAFEQKIEFAIENGVTPSIIALNPTLELSVRNVEARTKKIGRGVIKEEVVSKFYGFHGQLEAVMNKYPEIACTIINKKTNDIQEQTCVLGTFEYASKEEVANEYDRIIALIREEERQRDCLER